MTDRDASPVSLSKTPPFGADRFAALWRRCVASPPSPAAATVYATLIGALDAPGRHFHNLGHIRECVARVDEVAPLLAQRDAVELGLWFHDAILVPGASDNERRSAELFLESAAGADPSLRRRVARLILATAHAAHTQYDDRAFMVDIDLAGLAAPWDEFMRKGDLLRLEHAELADDAYYLGQVAFFQRLLKRHWLFATPYFRAACEIAARANLHRLLALRAAQGYSAS